MLQWSATSPYSQKTLQIYSNIVNFILKLSILVNQKFKKWLEIKRAFVGKVQKIFRISTCNLYSLTSNYEGYPKTQQPLVKWASSAIHQIYQVPSCVEWLIPHRTSIHLRVAVC